MKKVQVIICLSCFSVLVDGVLCTDHDEITKFILLSKYAPRTIFVYKHICPKCCEILSEEECKKLLNKGG
jgi:hypothetical protein